MTPGSLRGVFALLFSALTVDEVIEFWGKVELPEGKLNTCEDAIVGICNGGGVWFVVFDAVGEIWLTKIGLFWGNLMLPSGILKEPWGVIFEAKGEITGGIIILKRLGWYLE